MRTPHHVERGEADRPGSSTFSITASGEARLGELLAQPIQPVPPRNGLMLRLFFGRTLGPDACRSLLLEARDEAERRLAEYEAVRHELAEEEEHAADRPYWLLTVSAGARGASSDRLDKRGAGRPRRARPTHRKD